MIAFVQALTASGLIKLEIKLTEDTVNGFTCNYEKSKQLLSLTLLLCKSKTTLARFNKSMDKWSSLKVRSK